MSEIRSAIDAFARAIETALPGEAGRKKEQERVKAEVAAAQQRGSEIQRRLYNAVVAVNEAAQSSIPVLVQSGAGFYQLHGQSVPQSFSVTFDDFSYPELAYPLSFRFDEYKVEAYYYLPREFSQTSSDLRSIEVTLGTSSTASPTIDFYIDMIAAWLSSKSK